jgi:hypothetical protein
MAAASRKKLRPCGVPQGFNGELSPVQTISALPPGFKGSSFDPMRVSPTVKRRSKPSARQIAVFASIERELNM